MTLIKKIVTLCVIYSATIVAHAVDINISGYGSIIGGKVLNGDIDAARGDDIEFVADFFDVGIYDEQISFLPDSMLAIQADAQLTEDLKVTTQLVAKGVDHFEPELDWYYLTYKVNNQWSIRAGRRNIPMYYYSEFMEIGYAYPWIRPSPNVYWWQVTQFNGVTASYKFLFNDGEYANTINFFYGNERSPDNKEMNYFASIGFYGHPIPSQRAGTPTSVDDYWDDITGVNWSITHDYFDLRASYFTFGHRRDVNFINNRLGQLNYRPNFPESGQSSFDWTYTFVGLGGAIYLNPVTILFDYNRVSRDDPLDTTYPTYLLSAVYEIGEFKPYISISKTDHSERSTDDLEQHKMLSIGLRYDFAPNVAFKIQYDDFTDEGNEATGWNFHGDVSAISMGIDFIF